MDEGVALALQIEHRAQPDLDGFHDACVDRSRSSEKRAEDKVRNSPSTMVPEEGKPTGMSTSVASRTFCG